MAELLINNKDAFKEWGVRIGKGFLDVINSPLPLKEFIENESRLEHGKRVVYDNTKIGDRDLTLHFTIEGKDKVDFRTKKKAFESELYKGKIKIQIPDDSNDIYQLTYLGKSVTYGQNIGRTFCKLSAKFNEPNPINRGF